MGIDKYVAELLYDYECVIIPGLGGFISDDKPVSINEVTHNFSPPFSTIHFNIHLHANDGLLIYYIAQQEHIEYNIAKQKVDKFVSQCKNSLDTGSAITFKDIGSLYLDDDKNIVFEQDNRVNYNSGSFGLTSLVSPSIKRITDEEKLKSVVISAIDKSRTRKKPVDRIGSTEASVLQSKRRRPIFKNSLIVLLAFVFLMGSGYLYLNKDATINYYNKYSSHIPFFYSSVNDYLSENINSAPVAKISQNTALLFPKFFDNEKENNKKDDVSAANEDNKETTDVIENNNPAYETNDQPIITTDENATEDVEVANDNSDNEILKDIEVNDDGSEGNTELAVIPESSSTTTSLSEGRFLIIAGSFSNELNARSLVDQLKDQGFDAVIADTSKNGMYRVAIMRLRNRVIAMEKLLAIRNESNPDAWLLIK